MFWKRNTAVFGNDELQAARREFESVAVPQLSHLYKAAIYLAKEQQLAQDLVQETYAKAFQFFDKFEPGTNCRAWLLTILRNVFYNHHRRHRGDPEPVDPAQLGEWAQGPPVFANGAEAAEAADPVQILAAQSMDDKVEKALKALPEEFRTAVVLVDMEELTYDEAASVMKVPIGTVRSRVSRGRRLLHAALRDYAIRNRLIKSGSAEDRGTPLGTEK